MDELDKRGRFRLYSVKFTVWAPVGWDYERSVRTRNVLSETTKHASRDFEAVIKMNKDPKAMKLEVDDS